MCRMIDARNRNSWLAVLTMSGLCVVASAAVESSAQTSASQMPAVEVKALFANCAACHGADGGGVADGTIPAIGAQPATVITQQLLRFRSGERKDLRMQHFADPEHLADRQQRSLHSKRPLQSVQIPVALFANLQPLLELWECDQHMALFHVLV